MGVPDSSIGTSVVYFGYSGKGVYKNKPDAQNMENLGPIPRGSYQIQAPVNSPEHGPFSLPLLPSAENNMLGRSEFLIHGDSINSPGNASEGCIIMPYTARLAIWESNDHMLEVIS